MSTFPGTSTAQAVAADDWVENQQSAILQSFCLPDQRTFQQHMEEAYAEHGTRMYMCISLTFPHLTWNAL